MSGRNEDEDIVLYDDVCHSLTKQPLHLPSAINRQEIQESVGKLE